MNAIKRSRIEYILRLLMEGMGIRSIGRLAGVSRVTIGRYLEICGYNALAYQDALFRDLPIKRLQVDEMWTYINGRTGNVTIDGRLQERHGDTWVWMSLDPKSKLIPYWTCGCRSLLSASAFIAGIRRTVAPGVEIVSDGFNAYIEAIDDEFLEAHHRVAYEGFDYRAHSHTNHVERHNLTLRTSVSRLRRNTNGASKRWERLVAHLAIYTLYYNFVRTHRAHRVTPAMELGIAPCLWSFYQFVDVCLSEADAKPDLFASRFVFDKHKADRRGNRSGGRRVADHTRDDPYRISPSWRVGGNAA